MLRMLTAGAPSSLTHISMDLPQVSYPAHHDYRQGVVFEYYEGEWEWLPNFDEMKPANVGVVGNFLIEDTTETEIFRPKFRTKPSGPPGNFAVRFTTNIDIRQDGVYTFWLNSNDGSTLYIGNQLVIENDGTHYATEVEGRIMLTVGKHPMMVEFFHRNGKMLEGFRSTGPSLSVHYRPPGPIWSFGLTLGPKQIIKSMNLFYDHGDLRTVNLLNKYSQDSYLDIRADSASVTQLSHDGSSCYSPQMRANRQWLMSGDTMPMQPSTREMFVQMENAKSTIKDLEQIIRDQAQSHQKKMDELYAILQETMAQRDRLIQGLKQAQIFNRPWANPTMQSQSKPQPQSSGLAGMNRGVNSSSYATETGTARSSRYQAQPSWRNTIASVYLDAREDYSDEEDNGFDGEADQDEENDENENLGNETDSDALLERHLAEVERLKQLYFFSMALSVKMNTQMKLTSQQQILQASQESELATASLASSSSASGTDGTRGQHNNNQGGSGVTGSFSSFLSRAFTAPPKSNKQSPPTPSLQKLYEDCCTLKIPVESWPAYVSRTLGVGSFGGSEASLSVTAMNLPITSQVAAMSSYPLFANGNGGSTAAAALGTRGGGVGGGRIYPGAAAAAASTNMPVFVIL
ncbi:hypothetical protein BGW41_005912 [Actinomortierella wolfii]|nr:hypothetical protein BGW41_005912 [Actinomortierella wolfii]